jgi:hypothetical protein
MMIELSVIRDLVAIFGVIAGFSYYVLTVRNAQKAQQIAEKNRQIQLLSQLFATEEVIRTIIELLNMNWTDYDDFERKYGSDNNPDNYAKRVYVWGLCDNFGYMLRKDLIDRDLVFDRFHYTLLYLWAKFEGVIKEIRRRYKQPIQWIDFDYLVEECIKYYREKGIDITVLDTFFNYVPEPDT